MVQRICTWDHNGKARILIWLVVTLLEIFGLTVFIDFHFSLAGYLLTLRPGHIGINIIQLTSLFLYMAVIYLYRDFRNC